MSEEDRPPEYGPVLSIAAIAVTGAFLISRIWGLFRDGGKTSANEEIVLKPRHPSHRLVCECQCEVERGDTIEIENQTLDVPSDGCGKIDGARCEHEDGRIGKLKHCTKTAVPTGLEAVAVDQLPVAVKE